MHKLCALLNSIPVKVGVVFPDIEDGSVCRKVVLPASKKYMHKDANYYTPANFEVYTLKYILYITLYRL